MYNNIIIIFLELHDFEVSDESKARITPCVFVMLRWQLSLTQMKCTCFVFVSKSNTLWVILKENVFSF